MAQKLKSSFDEILTTRQLRGRGIGVDAILTQANIAVTQFITSQYHYGQLFE